MPSNGGDGNHEGSSGGDGSGRGYGGGSSGGGSSSEGTTFNGAKDSQAANEALGLTNGMTGKEVDRQVGNLQVTPTQTLDQRIASTNVRDALNWGVPRLAAIANPGLGMAMGFARSLQAGTPAGFVGGLIGSTLLGRLGVPGLGSVGQELGTSVALGKTPDFGKMATGFVSNAISRGVANETGSSLLGSVAGTATRSAINGFKS